MEGLVLLIVGLLIFLFVGSIRAFVAGSQISRLQEQVRQLRNRLQAMERKAEHKTDAPPLPVAEPPTAPKKEDEPEPLLVPDRPPAPEPKPFPKPLIAPPIESRRPAAPPPTPAEAPPSTPPAPPLPLEEPEPEREPVSFLDREPVRTTSDSAAKPPPTAPKREIRSTPTVKKPTVDWGQWVEEVVGKRWMTYAGGLAIFVSVGFFVKYAIDVGWIGPALRVGSGVALGIGILVLGDWLARRGTRTFGLGLIGAAGLPVLYVSLFAAFQLYDLIPQWMTFGAMILVTAGGMVLALRHDSLVVSFLSLVGGLLTPSLVATGHDSRDALFAYLLLLDMGVLGIAVRRRWRSLDVLAFLGTCFYFVSWFTAFYLEDPDPPMAAALAWLGAFYATFLILPFTWHLSQRTTATLERFVMGLAVAAAAFWVAYLVLHPDHRHALGVVALVMAACYATLGVLMRARLPEDRKAVFSFLAFAMTFVTIAVPLHFRLNGITVAWSAEAVLLLGLGFAYRYLPVRLGGLVVLGLAVGRLFVRHWPMHEEPYALLATAQFAIAALVCAAVAAFAIVHSIRRLQAELVDDLVRYVTGLAAGLLSLFVLHHELGTWLSLQEGALPSWAFRTTGGAVYGVGAIAFLVFGIRFRSLTARLASAAVLGIGALIVLTTYPAGFHRTVEAFINLRFPVAAGLSLTGIAIGLVLSRRRPLFESVERALGEILTLVGALALIGAIAVDLWHQLTHESLYAGLVGLTVLFAVAAAVFGFAAYRTRSAWWRLASFGLLVLATGTAWASHGAALPADFVNFLNTRFAVGLFVALSWIWQGERTRRNTQTFPSATPHDGAVLGFVGGVLLLLVLSVDLDGSLGTANPDAALSSLATLWAAGALSGLLAGRRAEELVWRTGSLLLLIAAGTMASMLYEGGGDPERMYFLSYPWGTVLLVAVVAFVWGTLQKQEAPVGEGVRCISTLLLLLATNYELHHGLLAGPGLFAARCGVTALNALAALAIAIAGFRLPSLPWRLMAALPLVGAWILGARLFTPEMQREFILFANLRFAALLVTVVVTFVLGRMAVEAGPRGRDEERRAGRFLLWLSVLFLFLVLSAETWHYAKQQAGTDQQAKFATQMALSVTWSVYAVGLLLAGFRLRLRAVRLTAIGLFAVTVAKLVLVDLAAIEQEQVFRILSFFVAGVLMIGGSYLYHRLEQKMDEPATEEDAGE